MDYTFFVKTDTGFSIAPEKIEIFASNYNAFFAQLGGSINVKADYTVKNERLTEALVDMSGSILQQELSMTIKGNSSCTYKDYDNTTVTLPDDLVA